MIVNWAIDAASGFVGWVLGWFPADFVVPDWFANFGRSLKQVIGGAPGLGVWIPWTFLFVVVALTVTLWASGFVVKFARWVLGLLPTMGGG